MQPNPASRISEELRRQYASLEGALSSLESRENTLRNAVKKWFGPIEAVDSSVRETERTRHDVVLQSLLRLHRLSCNLVPEHLRLPLQESDIFAAIILLNRIAITLRSPAAAVLCYCEARAIREQNVRVNQLDPLQLRHLLTFHQDIPHEEMTTMEIEALRVACEKPDATAIQTWFENVFKKKEFLPKDATQYLRQMATDLWNAGHSEFLDTFATELAVLDAAMFDALGWENTRLYFVLLKRMHGPACRAVSAFLNDEDFPLLMELSKQVNDNNQTVHFRALSTTYDAAAYRRLKTTILAAAKENGSRIRPASTESPLAKKKAVKPPPVYGTPEFFARNAARQLSA
ncbi:MAG: hypothetical protein QM790_13715 [Nibricoccus sp.]